MGQVKDVACAGGMQVGWPAAAARTFQQRPGVKLKGRRATEIAVEVELQPGERSRSRRRAMKVAMRGGRGDGDVDVDVDDGGEKLQLLFTACVYNVYQQPAGGFNYVKAAKQETANRPAPIETQTRSPPVWPSEPCSRRRAWWDRMPGMNAR
ncbi:hypothetical protein TWF696_001022 [Orbilia brochopaga]|uniref:Uncharacterized protein n=1 Tax=Orbilia brochopaga TaxID=3140254 RepID=A0AAV9VFS4_9PEZI